MCVFDPLVLCYCFVLTMCVFDPLVLCYCLFFTMCLFDPLVLCYCLVLTMCVFDPLVLSYCLYLTMCLFDLLVFCYCLVWTICMFWSACFVLLFLLWFFFIFVLSSIFILLCGFRAPYLSVISIIISTFFTLWVCLIRSKLFQLHMSLSIFLHSLQLCIVLHSTSTFVDRFVLVHATDLFYLLVLIFVHILVHKNFLVFVHALAHVHVIVLCLLQWSYACFGPCACFGLSAC